MVDHLHRVAREGVELELVGSRLRLVLLRRRRRGGKKRGAARRSDRDGRNDFTSYFPEENAFSSLEVDEDAMGRGVELGGIGRGGRVGQRSFY